MSNEKKIRALIDEWQRRADAARNQATAIATDSRERDSQIVTAAIWRSAANELERLVD